MCKTNDVMKSNTSGIHIDNDMYAKNLNIIFKIILITHIFFAKSLTPKMAIEYYILGLRFLLLHQGELNFA